MALRAEGAGRRVGQVGIVAALLADLRVGGPGCRAEGLEVLDFLRIYSPGACDSCRVKTSSDLVADRSSRGTAIVRWICLVLNTCLVTNL